MTVLGHLGVGVIAAGVAAGSAVAQSLPRVVVDRDNTVITTSCELSFAGPIADTDHNGVVHVEGNDLTIVFAADAHLNGRTSANASPDALLGIGMVIQGRNVSLRHAHISGFRVGILADNADSLAIANAQFEDLYRQELFSTRSAEVGSDWLFPHNNDNGEWLSQHGAAICVRNSDKVEIRNVVVRESQNGILLERVRQSKVYDCDCSFLSGWGLGLWRVESSTISRNAFDFCIRGYSHGVYNRGQDSAGILMFEQCHFNRFIENSATHGGDGLFAFAGKEALGEVNRREDINWYLNRGHHGNVFQRNDFSYAAAHGLELTFSADNLIVENRFVENAICGIWGGYSSRLRITQNNFERNGDMAYGLERGGINIEHGRENLIDNNRFVANKCGVHLWWDDDGGLLRTPWATSNGATSDANAIVDNHFDQDELAVHLRQSTNAALINNTYTNVVQQLDADDTSSTVDKNALPLLKIMPTKVLGTSTPVGARSHLAGREHIIMGRWGPFDWESELLVVDGITVNADGEPFVTMTLHGPINARRDVDPAQTRIGPFLLQTIPADEPGTIWKARLTLQEPGVHTTPDIAALEFWAALGGAPAQLNGSLPDQFILANWSVKHFASPCDPREDVDAWRAAAANAPVAMLPTINLMFGGGGPKTHDVGHNHFGTVATTTMVLPKGRWSLQTRSDDGIRVWVNDTVLIDDWTWHAPKDATAEFDVTSDNESVTIRVEHFELDGHSELKIDLRRAG